MAKEKITREALQTLASEADKAAGELLNINSAMESRLSEVRAGHMPEIIAARKKYDEAHTALQNAVTAVGPNSDVFPEGAKSDTVGMMAYGWKTKPAGIVVPDEAKTIDKIDRQTAAGNISADLASTLVRVKKALNKSAVKNLGDAILKKIGVEVVGAHQVAYVSYQSKDVTAKMESAVANANKGA